MKMVIGIDPGMDGAIFFDSEHKAAWSMPTFEVLRNKKKKREIDIAGLVNLLAVKTTVDAVAYVEQVGAMPGQGVTSMFTFGKGYGILLGVLGGLYIPVVHVSPVTWKKALAVRGGKEAAMLRASELMPHYSTLWAPKKGEITKGQAIGLADAALIAYDGRQLEGAK